MVERIHKSLEDEFRVDRTRICLRMKLNREYSPVSVSHALIRAIVRVKELWTPIRREGLLVHCKSMVLGRDEAAFRPDFNAWLILSSVPILQLERVRPHCE